jgi:hypothetical protein
LKVDDNSRKFKFQLNFYTIEIGDKQKVLTFTCDEELPPDTEEKELKSHETKEFAFIHVFQRMIPAFW